MRRFILVALTLAIVPTVRAADAPVATVAGTPISRADLEQHVKAKLIEIENERYEALKEGLDELVAEELVKQEAKARNTTPEALMKSEVMDKVTAPSDADVQKLYEANKEALNNQPLEAVKPRIVEYMKQQQAQEKQEAFIGSLKQKYKTTVALRPPVIEVATAGRPERGPAKAPITIIEFSDYECPFCKRAEETVNQVMDAYKDKVRLVYRHYPLPFHPNAKPAAEAAMCANAQGKFWEYHTKIFKAPALTADGLKTIAGEVGLDKTRFDECLAKNTFAKEVEKDMADGSSVGVSGTPAFFINGRMLSGAQPFEKFKEIIDEELAAQGGGTTS